MDLLEKIQKRIVVISWKNQRGHPMEVFSNLKILCLTYPQFNYNTLNNYLGKAKTAYENELVKIERLPVFSRPVVLPANGRKMAMVVNRQPMQGNDEKQQDVNYWLKRPVIERLQAVTSIVAQSKRKGQRMEKVITFRQKAKR